MKIFKALTLSLAAAALTAQMSTAPTSNASAPAPMATMYWRQLLQSYSTAYSLYFTIERDEIANKEEGKGGGESSLVDRRVPAPPNVMTRDQFIALLQQWLPKAEVVPDPTISNLFHIREKSLSKRTGYLLDEKLSLDFKGTILDFIDELNRRSDGKIDWNHTTGYPGPGLTPFRVGTQVTIRDATYRAALDAAMPHTTNHILWETQTAEINGKPVVIIDVTGPLSYTPAPVPTTTTQPGPPTTQLQRAASQPAGTRSQTAPTSSSQPFRLSIFVLNSETVENARFPVVVQVQNTSDNPVTLNPGLLLDIRSDRVGEASQHDWILGDYIVAVLQVRYPFVNGREGPSIPPARITQERLRDLTIQPRMSSFNRYDFPPRLFTPGDNTLELTLVYNGIVIATSGVTHIHCTAPASQPATTQKTP